MHEAEGGVAESASSKWGSSAASAFVAAASSAAVIVTTISVFCVTVGTSSSSTPSVGYNPETIGLASFGRSERKQLYPPFAVRICVLSPWLWMSFSCC